MRSILIDVRGSRRRSPAPAAALALALVAAFAPGTARGQGRGAAQVPAQPHPARPAIGPAALVTPAAPAPLLLVPPRRSVGRVRIDTVATSNDIDRVVFFVDDHKAADDGFWPFSVRLDLPAGDAPRTLKAVAYGADGRRLGEDTLTLDPERRAFGVSIESVTGRPDAGSVDVELSVSVPPARGLDHLEIYRNRTPVARLTGPPFRLRVPTPEPRPDDYLRAVAYLDDGSSLEDARPLLGEAPGAHLEVNLVQLFAVATDRRGRPVGGLGPEDFAVRLGGRELAVDRFRRAGQVPLVLGLLVDSSTSMAPVMGETKSAAEQFLDDTLIPGDRALLVDVDSAPRLAHGLTGEPARLAAAFDDLEAGGGTALWDSIVYAALELERQVGRRALVVLTDGQDTSSHLDAGQASRYARRAGVPVYVLALGDLATGQTQVDAPLRLASVARRTGGRIFHIQSPDELARAYAEIDQELRNQYVLSVALDRLLSEDDLANLQVQPRKRGLEVRTARSQ